ncbi:hypothetical protein BSKO_05845 [Bryopsis sp. KO-2023]|nr:hypothetical protein BSKO_05845 [Bryopsis sp. KO-2023]
MAPSLDHLLTERITALPCVANLPLFRRRLKDHFFDDEGDLLMVFEKHECDLSKFIDKRRPRVHNGPKSLKPDLIKHLMKELLTGVKQLHSQFVVHRDLNLQNILVSTTKRDDDKPVVCIAGLGQAMTMPISTHTHEVMMLCYRPPEILLGGHYTCQVDMWSVGCIFAQLFLGNSQKPLFDADCEFYQLINIFKMLGLPNEDIWPGVTKLPYWHDFCRHDFFLHEYPRLKPGKLNTTMGEFVNGDNDALDLLVKMLHCDPSQRIHVRLEKGKI